jgi:hypothetical protein
MSELINGWKVVEPIMRSPSLCVLGCLFFLLSAMESGAVAQEPTTGDSEEVLLKRTLELIKAEGFEPGDAIGILVEQGDQQTAENYYKRIGERLGFSFLGSDLSQLLAHFGYIGLSAEDLEYLPSDLLMPNDDTGYEALAKSVVDEAQFRKFLSLSSFQNGNVLSSRFFAPKIVKYAQPTQGANPYEAGWRKLVRLKSLAGSEADAAGVGYAYLLFNYFEPDPNSDPFRKFDSSGKQRESGNNQIILTPRQFKADEEDAVYWAVYQPWSKQYKIGFALNAGFDLPDNSHDVTRDYFVPTACAECHGHDSERGGPAGPLNAFPYGKVNYLDTDQWYDMAEFDFPGTVQGPFDVLMDGGKDHSQQDYTNSVDVIRRLNAEIAVQNAVSAKPASAKNFQLKAVDQWLTLHTKDASPVPQSARALDFGDGVVWKSNNSADQELLGMLNRYCFRCHSSMFYHVFDKSFVLTKKKKIQSYVSSEFMPQGRQMSPAERSKLVELLEKLQ